MQRATALADTVRDYRERYLKAVTSEEAKALRNRLVLANDFLAGELSYLGHLADKRNKVKDGNR